MPVKAPKSAVREIALLARDLSDNGLTVMEFMMDVLRGTVDSATVRDRIEAGKVLLERGWGKAPIEVNVNVSVSSQFDMAKLSSEQLDQLRGALSVAAAVGALPSPDEFEDAEIEAPDGPLERAMLARYPDDAGST